MVGSLLCERSNAQLAQVDGLFSVSSVGLQALDGVSEIQPGTIFSLHMDTLQEPAARLSLVRERA